MTYRVLYQLEKKVLRKFRAGKSDKEIESQAKKVGA
jgi:hypothetical protein